MKTSFHPWLFSFILLLNITIEAYVPAPLPIPPLQFVQVPIIVEVIWEKTTSILFDAVFPGNLNDAVAVGISEGVSGLTGGIASKLAAKVDGNKDTKDGLLANAGTSGVFFALRGGLRALAELGVFTPTVVNVGSLVLATVISELVKLRARAISEQQTRVGDGPTMLELMKFQNPKMQTLMNFREVESKINSKNKVIKSDPNKIKAKVLKKFSGVNVKNIKYPVISEIPIKKIPVLGSSSKTEIVADVTKWLVYDITIPNAAYVPLEISANIGALAGICSQLIKETKERNKRLTLPIQYMNMRMRLQE